MSSPAQPRRTYAALRARLRALPKVELHCHLDGSLRPQTLLALARAGNIPLPANTPETLATFMRASNVQSLQEYLARFDITLSVMQTEGALERIAYELVEDAAHENIRYIEVRQAPLLSTQGGLTAGAVVEAVLRGLSRGEAAFGTKARLILCALRQWEPRLSSDTARLAVRYKDRGVVGFDLAGAEAGYAAAVHADAFLHARANDLFVTCHAGEADGPASMRQALHVCGAYRIGHGTRALEDPALFDFLVDRQIPLEMCPTSNVQTRVTESYVAHPLRMYFEAGIPVSINTDNRLISGVSLTDEYVYAATEMGFSYDDIIQCMFNACHAAFLPLSERQTLYLQLWEEISQL